MPRAKASPGSKPKSKTALRSEIEAKIRAMLEKAAGKRPYFLLCSRHKVKAKHMITGTKAMVNAGRWGAYVRTH